MDKLHAMAAALIKYETIDGEQIDDIMAGRDPRPPKDWSEDEPSRPGRGQRPGEDLGHSSTDPHLGRPASEHRFCATPRLPVCGP